MRKPDMDQIDIALRGRYPESNMSSLGLEVYDKQYTNVLFFGCNMFVLWDYKEKIFTCYTKSNFRKQEKEE